MRYSHSFFEEFATLLEQGVASFGPAVVAEKRDRVLRMITEHLAYFPVRPIDPDVGKCTYPVTTTPFVLIYDYDDAELRIYLIVHGRADRTALDLSKVRW